MMEETIEKVEEVVTEEVAETKEATKKIQKELLVITKKTIIINVNQEQNNLNYMKKMLFLSDV